MHCWGDEWFNKYGNDLYKAQNFIWDYVKRWSRCNLISKEKYGTIRYECLFPPYSRMYLNTRLQRWWVNESWLHRKWARFGWYVCARAIKKAIKKWPHLEEELCCDFWAGKFGKECENKYWVKVS